MEETKEIQSSIHVVSMSAYTTPELIEERASEIPSYVFK